MIENHRRVVSAMRNETRELVQHLLSRLEAGDLDGVADCFDPSRVDFRIPHADGVPWIPEAKDRAGVREFFAAMSDQLISESFEVESLLVQGGDAALRGQLRSTVRATGRTIDSPFVIWITVSNGRIVRYHLYEDSFAVARAAGVAEPSDQR